MRVVVTAGLVVAMAGAARADDAHRSAKLDAVALDAARSASTGYVVSAEALRGAMAAHLGSGLWPHVLVATGTDEQIAAQLADALAELRAAAVIDEIGMATASGPAGRVGVLVAVPPPPLPISIERLGGSSRITLAWPWAEPAAAFAVTSTAARRLEPHRTADGVELAVDCTRRGAIEVIAGTRIVASVVDPCDRDETRDAPGAGDIGPPAETRVELEQRLFALVNRERAQHGQHAIAWDAGAQAFARAHAADMAAHGYVGHQTPAGASYHTRVADSAYAEHATHENVGHATGPGEVHTAFLGSPGHRANLLADDVERGAVGIAPDPRDAHAFYVTEFFWR